MTILRAKRGGHILHVVGKKGGKLLVKNPADDLMPVQMTQEQVDAIAELAWEWDEGLYKLFTDAHSRCFDLMDVNDAVFGKAAVAINDCLELINKLRNGEK